MPLHISEAEARALLRNLKAPQDQPPPAPPKPRKESRPKASPKPVAWRAGVLMGKQHLWRRKFYRPGKGWLAKCMRETGSTPRWDVAGVECPRCYK